MTLSLIEVTLASGRYIRADRVHLAYTYEGLLEGKPNEELNSDIIGQIPNQMKRIFGNYPVFIQKPKIARTVETHPFLPDENRVVEAMPPLVVAARFTSYAPVENGDASALIIVWFQSTPSPFLDVDVRGHIEKIEWESEAEDFDW